MDANSTDTEPGKTLVVSDDATFHQNNSGKLDSNSVQTLNGSQIINSDCSGSPATSVPAVNSAPVLSKTMHGETIPPTSSSVTGPTVTLIRPPATLNGNNTVCASANATDQHVNNGQLCNSVSASGAAHIIKAEPPAAILQTSDTSHRLPAMSAAPAAAGIRNPTPQMLAPRLPQTSPGQPSIQNIQLPPGMVLVRSESGQLLMIPQQALAQMQAQAQAGGAPRTAAPVNAPGNTIISRQVRPSAVIRQPCPPSTSPIATTALHRPPLLQVSQSPVGLAGITPRCPVTTVTSLTVSKETMENVKKCRNFLSTLIKLASTGKQSTETAASVRQLVKELLEGKLEAEEFTSRLYKELNSSPQPYLVPFLERSLPALRQLTPDSAAFIQQSQLPQAASGPVSSPTVVLSSPAPRLTVPVSRPQLLPAVNKPGQMASVVLHSQQPRTILRTQGPSQTTPMMTSRNQGPGRIVLAQQQIQPGSLRPDISVGSIQGLTLTQRNKLREAGGTFKDDDDINDVASMAGVNLSEESANILATNSGLVGLVTRSCKDEAFLSYAILQRRMLELGRRFGVAELGAEVVNFVSHATQQRLQNLLETVSLVAQQRNINFKEDERYEQSSDVRIQLKFFEQLDHLEKQRKEEQEREILLKAAKSRARQEDPEQLRLKQKAKEMQQQELAQMRQREANLTALAAIGPRKKRKNVDSPFSAASAEASGTGSSLTGGPGSSSASRPTRQRITRVNLRDLLFCLENEKFTSRSHFLYKGFLK